MMLTLIVWLWCAAAASTTASNTPPAAAPVRETLTPAQQKISSAQQTIEAGHATVQTYTDLAMALARRARETSDPKFYEQAEAQAAEALRREPGNYEAEKARVWILLGNHQFGEALRQAKALNARAPDDLIVYGMLVDAHVELGNYSEAETAAQWMLDLRPGHVAGLSRAAYLRELFGDLEGAAELMTQAYQRTPARESEERAWLLTHLAHLQRLRGRLSDADGLLKMALDLFPAYHYALRECAKLRQDQKQFDQAVVLLQKLYSAAPHPENLYALGEALRQAGREGEAKAAFREFEEKARAESSQADNANRELIQYYVKVAVRPQEALRLAELEIARRQDIYTRDVYALALLANHQRDEALRQWQKALDVGTCDPLILEHAREAGLKPTRAGEERRANP